MPRFIILSTSNVCQSVRRGHHTSIHLCNRHPCGLSNFTVICQGERPDVHLSKAAQNAAAEVVSEGGVVLLVVPQHLQRGTRDGVFLVARIRFHVEHATGLARDKRGCDLRESNFYEGERVMPNAAKVPRPCKSCGNLFTSSKRTTFCSDECFRIRKRVQPHTFDCVWCSKAVVSGMKRRFCSAECEAKHKKKFRPRKSGHRVWTIPHTCGICGVEFLGQRHQKSCSDECRVKLVKKQKIEYTIKGGAVLRARRCEITKRRLREIPIERVKNNLRRRLRELLHSGSTGMSHVIGCSSVELRQWLESKFTARMAWNNYGTYWVVDHVIPLAAFDLFQLSHRKRACHYTNLQPLTRLYNLQKGDTIIEPQMALL